MRDIEKKIYDHVKKRSEKEHFIHNMGRSIFVGETKKKAIIDCITLVVILGVFLICNYCVNQDYLKRFTLVSDGPQYCYGIDSIKREGNFLTLKGWFFKLKNEQTSLQNKNNEDMELMLALVNVNDAEVGKKVNNSTIMNIETMYENRPDVNDYFSCKYDYSKCGFTATIDCNELNLSEEIYRLVIKPDAKESSEAVLTNVYVNDRGVSYTDPSRSTELETKGTELDKIVSEGVRLASEPDSGCYIFQSGKKLYWIADENFEFCEDGFTVIQYQMDTTQIDNLPADRLENNWYWSNISASFEQFEITSQLNCGKYRVSMREIPNEYSVTRIWTGYHDGESWHWYAEFRPDYNMII